MCVRFLNADVTATSYAPTPRRITLQDAGPSRMPSVFCLVFTLYNTRYVVVYGLGGGGYLETRYKVVWLCYFHVGEMRLGCVAAVGHNIFLVQLACGGDGDVLPQARPVRFDVFLYHDIGIHAISSVLKSLFALLEGRKEGGTDIGSCRKQSKLDRRVNHGKQSQDL